jgi:hypothetical protein
MVADEKAQLINQLKEAHQATLATVRDLDLGIVIHTDSGWRVQDILGHLAQWYENRIMSVTAWHQGGEYRVPDYNTQTYNLEMAEQRKHQPGTEVLADWERGHAGFIALLEATPSERFEQEFMLPWGDYGPLTLLIQRMIAHEQGHCQEIADVL